MELRKSWLIKRKGFSSPNFEFTVLDRNPDARRKSPAANRRR